MQRFEWVVGEGCVIDMTKGVGLSIPMVKSLESVGPGCLSEACSLLPHDRPCLDAKRF